MLVPFDHLLYVGPLVQQQKSQENRMVSAVCPCLVWQYLILNSMSVGLSVLNSMQKVCLRYLKHLMSWFNLIVLSFDFLL